MNPVQLARVRKNPTALAFCSPACAGSGKASAECAECGATFHPRYVQRHRMRSGGKVYCSRDCFAASVKRSLTFKCAACGGVFYAMAAQKHQIMDHGMAVCGSCRASVRVVNPAPEQS